MARAQGDLQHRPGEEQPVWGDAVGVALPGVEQASLSSAVISRAERIMHHKHEGP